jgi:phosphonoacetaldehyde hydrolase
MNYTYSRRYQGPIQAVIFDWAGTIVDFGSCAPVEAFVELFKRRQINISVSEARGPMGMDKKAHVLSLLNSPRISEEWRITKNRTWDQSDVEDLYREFIPVQMGCLEKHSTLISGVLDLTHTLKQRGMKIGTTTGYNADMISVVAAEAKKHGFDPDAVVCSSDVPVGRPEPWMIFKCASRLKIFPMEAIVKVGDTVMDIEEGLNAGTWTIGVAKTGNELGLSEKEIDSLNPNDLNQRLQRARQRLVQAGAHFVVDGVADILPILNEIERRLRCGEKP